LELSSVRQLEDLIIEALYFDLINARINQERQVLEVDSVIGRDVRVGTSTSLPLGQDKTVASLLQSLKVWHDRVDFTLTELNYHIGAIKQREYVSICFVDGGMN
jgi:COP9 signalosome complex subunit 7